MLANRLVVVTGANKGIGYALVEKLLQHKDKPNIILTSRNPTLGEKAHDQLSEKYPQEKERLTYQELDIDSESSISAFTYWLFNNHSKFDVLINNAAIGDSRDIMGVKGYTMPPDVIQKTIQTNFFSTVEATEALLPFLSDEGKIVMESSTVGKFAMQGKPINEFLSGQNLTKEKLFSKMKDFEDKALNNEHVAAGYSKSIYNVTKAFLNAYTKSVLLPQLSGSQSCYTVYPGWCKTDLGGEKAPLSAEQGTLSTLTVLEFDEEASKKNNGVFLTEKGKPTSY